MSEEQPADRQHPVAARVQRERGIRRRWHDIVVRYDPGMLERHHQNLKAVMALPALPRKVKELIIVAIDSGKAWPGVKMHIEEAFREGATEMEIAEAILTAGIPYGPSAVVYGMEALDEILRERANRDPNSQK